MWEEREWERVREKKKENDDTKQTAYLYQLGTREWQIEEKRGEEKKERGEREVTQSIP